MTRGGSAESDHQQEAAMLARHSGAARPEPDRFAPQTLFPDGGEAECVP